jgi:hypothetical protein
LDAQLLNVELKALQEKIVELEQDATTKDKKCDKLLKQNAVLLRNMSVLFKTAQLEVQRKDGEIARLRQLYVQPV